MTLSAKQHLDLGVRAVAKQKEELQRQLAERKLQEVPGGAGAEQRRWAVLRQQLEEMERRGAKLERRMTELQAQNELLRELQREQQEPALRTDPASRGGS